MSTTLRVKAFGPRRGRTCVHCVVTRVARRLERNGSGSFIVCADAARPALVAMRASWLYLLVHRLLTSSPPADGGPVRVRVVNDPHPDVEVLISPPHGSRPPVRSLRVPRCAVETLSVGFSEVAAS
jgi:hypothetical protein